MAKMASFCMRDDILAHVNEMGIVEMIRRDSVGDVPRLYEREMETLCL